MFVTNIEYGIPADVQTANEPTWSFVEQQLRCLNGSVTDGVILQSAGASYMGVSGGMQNEYIVAGHLEGYGSYICASGRDDNTCKHVLVNGDLNEYPSRNVVDLNIAIAAAKGFYERGILTKDLDWEGQW